LAHFADFTAMGMKKTPSTTIPTASATVPIFNFRNKSCEILAGAIDRLSPKARLVASLYYFEELTMKEIGVILSVKESRVSQIHSKAMLQLRQDLEESAIDSVTRDECH